ncbi:MAG: hypothetical protein J0L78_16970 [Planctomycetes bacterium]|nr:hypothetical protein [Planctomycetota bacterium]
MRYSLASGLGLLASFLCGLLLAPPLSWATVEIDTDQTWTSPTSFTGDLIIRARLTIKNDVQVLTPGAFIIVEQGGILVIDGRANGRITISGNSETNSRWRGINYYPGSEGEIINAHIRSVEGRAIYSDGAPLIVRSTEISDVRNLGPIYVAGIQMVGVANFTIDRCIIHDIVGTDPADLPDAEPGANGPAGSNGVCTIGFSRNGGNGSPGIKGSDGETGINGALAHGITLSGCAGRISSSIFYNLRAGNGGKGSNAGQGGNGGPGGNGITCVFGSLGDGGNGNLGANGGVGGRGGQGGDAVGVHIENPSLNPNPAVTIEQCLFYDIAAGNGGEGGRGGAPGDGGAGGNGASSTLAFTNGGDAGDGANAGQNGMGGAAGLGGTAVAVRTVTPIGNTDVNQCTVGVLVKGSAGVPGAGGNTIAVGGAAGAIGTGTSSNGDAGVSGSNTPAPASPGAAASPGFSVGVEVDQESLSLMPISSVRNCILSPGSAGATNVLAFRTTNHGRIEATRNLYTGSPPTLMSGTGITIPMQLFGAAQFLDAPAGDYRVAAASPAVDSGMVISGFAPLTDLAGMTRRIDIASVANTGSGTPPIDLGAFEVQLPTCAGDLNGDGLVDDADFVAFASGYNLLLCDDPWMPVGCPADLNNDNAVDDADFSLFVGAYDELVCP